MSHEEENHPSTKELIINQALQEWWEDHKDRLGMYTPEEIAAKAFKGGVKWALLDELGEIPF